MGCTSFYRDHNGEASLKRQGFMIEWAKRAGKLVFQDAEDLHEDNIVTFAILALFWYSQGSWRLCYLHKGIDPSMVLRYDTLNCSHSERL